MPLLALTRRGFKAGIERRPLGNNSSPALTASKEIGTSVLQQQCSGFPQQRERALSKFFLESPLQRTQQTALILPLQDLEQKN